MSRSTSRFLRRRDPSIVERMDEPDCDPARLEATYRHFTVLNRCISGWGMLYRSSIRPLLRRDGTTTLLDVGCGGGDVAQFLLRRATRDGLALKVTGIDPDRRAVAFARDAAPAGMEVRATTAADVLESGERFDLVISNHVLHHLQDGEVPGFLEELAGLARVRAICSDIERSALGFALFSVGTTPLFRSSFITEDGQRSIRRSFRRDELARLAPKGWRVERRVPFRLVATRDLTQELAAGGNAPGEPVSR
jgi:2-polyprenyl-3-methyl-5-hydroxy-6-metoxy-1,4-benzoquinol methylase